LDTSGLSSGLSLAAFLLVFAYLSLALNTTPSGSVAVRLSDLSGRLSFTLRLLRLASVVAVVLSSLALVLSQSSPSVALIAIFALALIAFLAIVDRVAKRLCTVYSEVASNLVFPLQVSLLHLLSLPRASSTVPTEAGKGDNTVYLERSRREHNGVGADTPLDGADVVFTEEEQANLDERERLMIRSILQLDETMAREIMVPRLDIVAIEANTPLAEVAQRMLESGHSRLPVYSETIDNIVGVVYSRDLLPFLPETEKYPSLETVIRPAFFIPESKRLDELLRELQERRIHMAVVVDEYGGIGGLVTLEDLLEEIVGEIEDEFSRRSEPLIVRTAKGDFIVDAGVTLSDLSGYFSTPIGNEDVDTVGGLVYSTLGKMPQVGDHVVYNGLRIEVVSTMGRRLRRLKLSSVGPQKAQ